MRSSEEVDSSETGNFVVSTFSLSSVVTSPLSSISTPEIVVASGAELSASVDIGVVVVNTSGAIVVIIVLIIVVKIDSDSVLV